MPLNVFTIAGELKADVSAFERSLRSADAELRKTSQKIVDTENKAKELGQTTNTTARSFEKLRESVSQSQTRLNQAAEAFKKGAINSREFAQVLNQTGNAASRMDSKLKDTTARMRDLAAAGGKMKSAFAGGGIGASFLGNLSANLFQSLIQSFKQIVVESFKAGASFDKLARYVGTVDNSLKNTEGLNRFKKDLQSLATELPYTADQFAKASYTITSGLQVFGAERLTVLKEMGKAAAAANLEIEDFAENVTGALVAYKTPVKDLEKTFAMFNTAIGKAIVTDKEFMGGLNKLAPLAQQTGQSMETLLSGMAVMTKETKDAEAAFTNFKNVMAKIFDNKQSERLKDVFDMSWFKDGEVRQLPEFIEELGKKLDGLTKEEKIKKIGDVFTDLQVKEGILAMLKMRDEWKKGVTEMNGATDNLRKNTELALGGTENRWKQFSATFANMSADFGNHLAEGFFNVSSQTSMLTKLDSFGIELTRNVKGILGGLANAVADLSTGIFFPIFEAFGMDTSTTEAAKQRITEQFQDFYATVDAEADAAQRRLTEKNIKRWEGIVNSATSSPQQKQIAEQNIKTLQTQLAQLPKAFETIKAEQSQIAELGKQWGATFSNNIANGVNQGQIAQSGTQAGQTLVSSTSNAIDKNKSQVTTAVTNLSDINTSPFFQAGVLGGTNIGLGVVAGINAQRDDVWAATSGLAKIGATAFGQAIKARSPSLVFKQFGHWMGEGLVIGLNDSQSTVSKASTDLFKAVLASAKDVTKKIKEQVKELTKTLKDLNTENAVTFEGFTQTIGFRVSIAEAEKLKAKYQEIFDLQIEMGMTPILDKANLDGQLSGLEKFRDIFAAIKDTAGQFLENKVEFRDMLLLFADPNAQKGLDDLAKSLGVTRDRLREIVELAQSDAFNKLLEIKAPRSVRDSDDNPLNAEGGITDDLPILETLGGVVPEIKKRWEDFFGTFRAGLESMKSNLPSLKESLGENLLNAIHGISDVFGNAVQNWDGTISGFFKSVAQGFAQMAKQIIADLVRLMVYKALLKLFGSIAGGAAGGGGSAGDIGGSIGAPGGHASGGLIQGRGTGTSDSILARLSNGEFVIKAKAVSHFGADFFARLNNMQMPAFAGGGMVGGAMMSSSSTYNNQRSNVFNINVSGGGSPQQNMQTAAMLKKEIMAAIRKEERRNK